MTTNPTVFVIMPFDEEFDAVYCSFMKPVLEQIGFKVDRADDIESHQNILKDILNGIFRADLIVADLTGSNPNVFYELGLAHAFRKPVILATQSIEDVPFDLRSYRLLEYSTHFAKIGDAREKLTNYAKGVLEQRVPFGSPVTDFLQEGVAPYPTTVPVPRNTLDGGRQPEQPFQTDERGYLDHLIDITSGYNRIAEIASQVTEAQEDMTLSIGDATAQFNRISSNSSASSPSAARSVARRLAEALGTFNTQLQEANTEYSNIAQGIEDSLEFVVSFQLEQSDATDPQVEQQLSSLRDLRSVVMDARDSYLDMAKAMEALPRIERRLNREVASGSQEIRAMASNMDRIVASISRALRDD